MGSVGARRPAPRKGAKPDPLGSRAAVSGDARGAVQAWRLSWVSTLASCQDPTLLWRRPQLVGRRLALGPGHCASLQQSIGHQGTKSCRGRGSQAKVRVCQPRKEDCPIRRGQVSAHPPTGSALCRCEWYWRKPARAVPHRLNARYTAQLQSPLGILQPTKLIRTLQRTKVRQRVPLRRLVGNPALP